ncbi:MAG: helix-turn-helix domain-containing protein [Deltaproteobacteria bacterium]|nr:helix-turn-helix domain-containing protein [Deltaproteobacteria bacterium]
MAYTKHMPIRKNIQTSLLAEYRPLMTFDEVQQLLNLTRRSVARLVSEGRLRGPKITRGSGTSGRRLILRDSVERLIVDGMDV